jgi:hypothetical protein
MLPDPRATTAWLVSPTGADLIRLARWPPIDLSQVRNRFINRSR